jgi:hypothetical protein
MASYALRIRSLTQLHWRLVRCISLSAYMLRNQSGTYELGANAANNKLDRGCIWVQDQLLHILTQTLTHTAFDLNH